MKNYTLVFCVWCLSAAVFGAEEQGKIIESLVLRTDWSVKDLKEIGRKIASRKDSGKSHFRLNSIRFFDDEDIVELIYFEDKGDESVGGWRIKLKNDGKNYVYFSKEWFDV